MPACDKYYNQQKWHKVLNLKELQSVFNDGVNGVNGVFTLFLFNTDRPTQQDVLMPLIVTSQATVL